MKEKILTLRLEGKTYEEISKALGCSKSTVCYHCDDKQKGYYLERRNINRKKQKNEVKLLHGGKCSCCGYNRCLDALDFHHRNPESKTSTVSNLFSEKGKKAAFEEAEKCVLLCANCHRELHSNVSVA